MKASGQYSPIPVTEIFQALARTPGGKYLKTAVRYNMYREPHETVKFWRSVLGPTAITFSHMKHMYKITKSLMNVELQHNPLKFTSEEQRKLLIGVACHDYGEAIIDGEGCGDISFVFKTGDSVSTEEAMCNKVLDSLPIDEALKHEMGHAYHEVVMNEQSDLFKFFRDVEQTEYLMAAMNVYNVGRMQNLRIHHDKVLIGNTLGPNLEPIIENVNQYPSIAKFLRSRVSDINGMFEYASDDYKKSKLPIKAKIGDIDSAFAAWQKFIFSG